MQLPMDLYEMFCVDNVRKWDKSYETLKCNFQITESLHTETDFLQ